MSNIWFASDHHFFHKNILEFENDDGSLIRGALFDNIDEHNERLVENHNAVVKDSDHFWFGGDLTMHYGEEFLSLFARLKGKKRFIPGNHDEIKKLAPLFKKVQIWRVFREAGDIPFTYSHVPIDHKSIKGIFNLHGHIHSNKESSWRHMNVSMENINYTPISYEEVQANMRRRLEFNESCEIAGKKVI